MNFAEMYTIVTIPRDSGMRQLSIAEFLSQYALTPKATRLEILGII